MLLVLGNQQVDGLLRDADLSDGRFRLGTREGQFAVGVLDVLLADGDGFVLDVEVAPQESSQFTLAQSADQLQIEHGQQAPLVRGVEVYLDMLRLQYLHLEFLHLRRNAILGWVAEDQALFHGAVQCIVEHQVQAADGGAAETRIAVAAFAVGAATLHQLFVELLSCFFFGATKRPPKSLQIPLGVEFTLLPFCEATQRLTGANTGVHWGCLSPAGSGHPAGSSPCRGVP